MEDEDQIRTLINEVFIRCGFETYMASTEEEGWALFAEHKSRMAFAYLDCNLKFGNGYSLYKRIRAFSDDVFVVLSSGLPKPEYFSILKDSNGKFLQKPFHVGELIRLIEMRPVTSPTKCSAGCGP